jgi:hypothetical protein
MTKDEQAEHNRSVIRAAEPDLADMIEAVRSIAPRARVQYVKVEGLELGKREAYDEPTEPPLSFRPRKAIDKRSLRDREQEHIRQALEARAAALGGTGHRGRAPLGRGA